ncbi:hypothetical protein LPJ60_002492 [Coemansia sp. RSA 2675]|nr:hypothetical protein LPJ60_002492 [Coemansia sp. RSA 2675]
MDNLRDCDIALSAVLPLAADVGNSLSGRTKCLSVGGTDVIAPFHTARVPAPRAPKAMPQSRATNSGSKNRFNRVRRRSPLCHDMLEFMLEDASMSSQESLPLETTVAATNPGASSNPNTHHSHRTLGTAAAGADLDAAFVDESLRLRDLASTATISSGQKPHPLDLLVQQKRYKGDIIPTPPTSDHVSDDDGSEDEANGNSDDGFDGQCPTPSATTSASSTTECSRSNSYRSSRSSEASDDATAAEPSLNWWKRRFKGVKHKPALPLSASPRSDTLTSGSSTGPVRPSTDTARLALSNSTPAAARPSMTMLTKLRRSVSTKKTPKSPTPEPARRSHTVVVSPKKLTRSTTERRLPPLAAAHSGAVHNIESVNPAHRALNKPTQPPSFDDDDDDDDDLFEAQWILLKCKGMVNLHVVSVPASVSSLNHKDAFLFYPCLFRKLGTTHASGLGAAASQALDNVTAEPSAALLDAPSSASLTRLHMGTLLAQEYNRRKSICSLASRAIYAWIGAHASAIKRDAVIRVAMEIRDKELMGKATIVIVDESTTADSARRELFTQLHLTEHAGRASPPSDMATLCKQLTPLSKAGDDLDFERALQRRKVAYGFWEAVPPATILSVGADINAAMLLKVPVGGVVVLDTWSDVFIWWRDEPGNPAVRKCATDFANMLVRDACIPPRPKSASVWHELRGFEHVVFKTKFSDWPFVFASSMTPATPTAHRMSPQPLRSPPHPRHAAVAVA